MVSGKNRLYIAYYSRGFHTALLFAPKNPSPKNRTPDTTRYHVYYTILESGEVQWQYEEKLVFPRTPKLVAVMLLFKLTPGWNQQAISNLLRQVPVPVENKNKWDCPHSNTHWVSHRWVWAAIDKLVAAGAINPEGPGLASTAEGVWRTGLRFAEPYRVKSWDPNLQYALPTCDTAGNSIKTEFPAR
ncbi:hypothetical protein GGX14DRAFT_693320 [Mycena pura]|uniref:Uncharacterized protein n=1 Tax=Mycena pura TaxID=153505 RepID=A0AAD6YS90_9AGAR|nr:hypothetical protein GGX14DRAFT_693320 [Mycena pura]